MFPFPKIIHLTYKSIPKIPDMWKEVLPAWKKTHPDWEIKFWTDEDNDNLINTKFKWFKSTYDNFPYNIQKIDAIRVCYLYVYGGIYVDMDYIPLKNLNTLFENTNDEMYFTTSANVPIFTNSFMASKPNIPFWITFLKTMNNKLPWYYSKHFIVFNSTGPFALDKLLSEYNKTFGFIPSKIIHACNVCDKPCKTNLPKEYLKAIEGYTWNSYDSKIINFIFCNHKIIILSIGILVGITILNTYKKLSICKDNCPNLLN
jgi:mannosyltransferase OCH1-like enzyme